ncbi:MAG: DNA-binding protein [Proteobacteria bacterium]|nr:DNA-binding protein [Pseudomonadota bacterium]MDA1057164.1 DNA-binding protein [Pseudomonadota bacterium]
MANLTIRNIDDDVVFALKKRARRNHRSLEAELRDILSGMSRKPQMKFLAERIASMTPEHVRSPVRQGAPRTTL